MGLQMGHLSFEMCEYHKLPFSKDGFLHSVFREESHQFHLKEFEVLPIECFQSKNNNDKSNKAVALVHFFLKKYQL